MKSEFMIKLWEEWDIFYVMMNAVLYCHGFGGFLPQTCFKIANSEEKSSFIDENDNSLLIAWTNLGPSLLLQFPWELSYS